MLVVTKNCFQDNLLSFNTDTKNHKIKKNHLSTGCRFLIQKYDIRAIYKVIKNRKISWVK